MEVLNAVDPMRVLLKSKLRVKVHSAQGLVCKHKQGYNNTSIRLKIGEKVQETEIAEKQRAPVWSQSFDFLVPDTKTSIYVTAYHHRKLKKDFLGRIVISVSDVLSLYSSSKSSAQEKIGYLFRNKSNLFDKDRGEVYISFDFVPIDFSVPSEPTSNTDPGDYTIGGVSNKDTPLFYSSLSHSKSLRFKSRSRPNLSDRDFSRTSFDWTEARLLKRENLARKQKYQNQWADTESETSASTKGSPNNPTSSSDSDADGSLSDIDYGANSVSFSHKSHPFNLSKDFPLQRGSPDGSSSSVHKSKELISIHREENTRDTSPLLSSSNKLRSSSALSVRTNGKSASATFRPIKSPHNLDNSPSSQQELSRPSQSAVITGRRSDRTPAKISQIHSLSPAEIEQITPRYDSSQSFSSMTSTSFISPSQKTESNPKLSKSIMAQLEPKVKEMESDDEQTWNLSSFTSEEAKMAIELRSNSKEKLVHMIIKLKQDYAILEKDQLETQRYLDELLSKIIGHHPELLCKN